MSAELIPSPPIGLERCPASPNRKRLPSPSAGTTRLCIWKYEAHRRSESPTSAPIRVLSSAARSAADGGPSLRSASSRLTKMRNRPSGSGEISTKPLGPDDNARPPRRSTDSVSFHVRDDEAAAISLAVEVLLHGVTREAVAAVGADQIVGPDDLLSAALVKRHGDAVAIGLDRRRLDAELNLNPLPGQMVAQHGLGAPLRLAALEFVFAAEARELGEPDARLPWTEKLDLFDAHAARRETAGSRRPYGALRAPRAGAPCRASRDGALSLCSTILGFTP